MSSRVYRQHCYLCDLPHTPWAILTDFSEPICRGCCNYEGAERIEYVIEHARNLRKSYEAEKAKGLLTEAGAYSGTSPSPPYATMNGRTNSSSPNSAMAAAAAAQRKYFVANAGSYTMGRGGSGTGGEPMGKGIPASLYSSRVSSTQLPLVKIEGNPSGRGYAIPVGMNNLPRQPGMENDADATAAVVAAAAAAASARKSYPGPLVTNYTGQHHGVRETSGGYPDEQTRLVRDTLSTLNKATPFDVRFKKDPSLRARAVHFDVFNKSGMQGDFEMKVVVEYPYGSGVTQSASGATKQMQNDSLKDLGKSSTTSGYKALEYEKVHGSGEWITLADLITESVRYFKDPVTPDLLPTPYRDNDMSNAAAALRASRNPRKRRVTPELDQDANDTMMIKQTKEDNKSSSRGNDIGLKSSLPTMNISNISTTAIPSASVSPMVSVRPGGGQVGGGDARNRAGQLGGVDHGGRLHNGITADGLVPGKMSAVEKNSNMGAVKDQQNSAVTPGVLTCVLCNGRLEDTHFVQCPSVAHHKFCFPCSRKSIVSQKSENAEVFCPSGERCPLQGSNLPWAFMPEEIKTIEGYGINPNGKDKEK